VPRPHARDCRRLSAFHTLLTPPHPTPSRVCCAGAPSPPPSARGREEAAAILRVVSGGQLVDSPALADALVDLKLGKGLDASGRAINIGVEDSPNASVTVRTISTVADCYYSLRAVSERTGVAFDATFASLQAALLQPLKVG
jgi:hypothetical protein